MVFKLIYLISVVSSKQTLLCANYLSQTATHPRLPTSHARLHHHSSLLLSLCTCVSHAPRFSHRQKKGGAAARQQRTPLAALTAVPQRS
ncbi:hypothetical protein J3E74DRAFT_25795 [Bipolaris maydis]|nr:hypothetical protein J3E74DRAFT_25795 [Bipolaris maydis]